MTNGATATTKVAGSMGNPAEGSANAVELLVTNAVDTPVMNAVDTPVMKLAEKTVAEATLPPRIQQVVEVVAEARTRRLRHERDRMQ